MIAKIKMLMIIMILHAMIVVVEMMLMVTQVSSSKPLAFVLILTLSKALESFFAVIIYTTLKYF